MKKDIFHFLEKSYNLKKNSILNRRCNRSVYLGRKTKPSLAPKIQELLPNVIKNDTSMELFKKEIKL